MAVDTFNYSLGTQALQTAQQSIANATNWRKNFDYEIGQTTLFNNAFYSANYSHNSGEYFDEQAWTKINNSADRIKNIIVDDSAKANGKSLVYNSTTNKMEFQTITSPIIDKDSTLASNSDTTIPSTKAVKTYIDSKVVSVTSGMEYKGIFDVLLGVLPTNITTGDFYKVLNNGTINGVSLNNGDMIIANKTKTEAISMSDFDVIDNTESADILRSVNISTNTDFNIDTGKLTDRNTIKSFVEEKLGNETLQTTSQTIKGAINEVFQSGTDVKVSTVSAVSSKGQAVTTQNTWTEIINAINNIQTGTGTSNIQEVTKLNVIASTTTPYTHAVNLTNPIIDKKIIYGVREFTQGSEQTTLVSTFNNSDSSSFKPNDNIIFDGSIKLADKVSTGDMIDSGALDIGSLYTYNVDKTSFNKIKTIEGIDNTLPQIKIVTLNNPTVLEGNGDIDLSNIQSLSSIIFNTITTNGGKCLLAVSVDSGVTYKVYNLGLGQWQTIDISNLNDFAINGMTKTITDSLTSTELEILRGDSNKIRFAYYLSVSDINSIAESNDISIGITMSGYYNQANKTDYDVVIGENNQSIQFKFYKNGTFTINYMN